MTNKTISKITRNLIKETILSIVEDSSNQVKSLNNGEIYVIFEQSYHTIKIKKQDLIKLISSETYM
jgi:phage gp45-like